MSKHSNKTKTRASAWKLKAKKQEWLNKLRAEHKEVLRIRKDVAVEVTEVNVEAIELQAMMMEKSREEFWSQFNKNHATIVTIQ